MDTEKNTPAQDTSTKPWFIASIALTLVLIILLGGSLIFSYSFLDSFNEQELPAERSSWKLLLYSETMKMTTRVSALSGNLMWEDSYRTTKAQLEHVLKQIPSLVDSSRVRQKTEEVQHYYNKSSEIEERVYKLISRGAKDEALELLSGWDYTKNQIDFGHASSQLVELIQQRIEDRTSFQKTMSLVVLWIVLISVLLLVVFWTITIRLWKAQIRDKQRAEENVRNSEEKYRKLITTSPDSIAFIDAEGLILAINPSMKYRIGLERSQLEGKRLEEVMPEEMATYHMEKGIQAIQQGDAFFSQDERDGKIYENYYVPVFSYGGLNSFQVISKDITEQKEMEARLKEISYYDSLTGLYSRTFFDEEMRRLKDGRHCPLGIILCDVDGLKLINDAMGHDEGDRLLLAAADIIRTSFRESDIVSRIGGDEFVVLLPQTSEEAIKAGCSRINEEIARYNSDEQRFVLSISVGYAVANTGPVDMDTLFIRADDAMYAEKFQKRSKTRSKIIRAITKKMEARDYIPQGHAERLRDYSRRIGQELGLSEERLHILSLLSYYHDLGKVGIPEHIIFKPDPITDEEKELIQSHCEIGHRIAMSISDISHIADYILKHHERWDGKGYPLELKGEDIPLESRILAIAEAYDVMTSRRNYNRVLSHTEAVQELQRDAGAQFDPALVERFLKILEEDRNKPER